MAHHRRIWRIPTRADRAEAGSSTHHISNLNQAETLLTSRRRFGTYSVRAGLAVVPGFVEVVISHYNKSSVTPRKISVCFAFFDF